MLYARRLEASERAASSSFSINLILKPEKGTYGRRRARVFFPESVEFGGELGEFDLEGCFFGGFRFDERLELFYFLLRRRGLPTAS